MPEIRRSAIKMVQGKRTLFLTSFLVRDFIEEFYTVDRLDVQESTGMQRLLNESRARRFGNDIIAADKENEAFLPTSILLATNGSISYDEEKKELFFESAKYAGICPLDVVDGQHRIEGLKIAARDNKRLLEFPVSVTIAHNLSEPDRMLQFVTVNTTQQKVSDGVTQHIIARFTNMSGVEDLPYLPRWLKKQTEEGSIDRALKIVRYLNSEDTSPWKGRIHLDGDQKSHLHTVKQSTFVKSIKSSILSKNHPLNYLVTDDKKAMVLRNFWQAVREIFVGISEEDVTNSVAFKSVGLVFFHAISAPVINQLAKDQDYKKDAIKKCILSVNEYSTPDVAEMMSPDFWERGNKAGGLNSGALSKRAAAFSEVLSEASSGDVKV